MRYQGRIWNTSNLKMTGMRTSVLLLIILFLSCDREHKDPSLKFTANANNPLLSPGTHGEWDDMSVQIPYMVVEEGTCFLFYTGFSSDGPPAIGLATSRDGIHFMKYSGNPVFVADGTGMDAYGVGAQVIVREQTGWVMYYNAREISGYGPGPNIGRATADALAGPWNRGETPVMLTGKTGEWDAGFVFPTAILIKEDGMHMMYYSGGNGFDLNIKNYIGLATSEDGITWKKYNDPATTDSPFKDSDPVLMPGKAREWDGYDTWTCHVLSTPEGYQAVYSGGTRTDGGQTLEAGFATSTDGIHWNKFKGNPIFRVEDDPLVCKPDANAAIEFPLLVITDTAWLLYYDYGSIVGKIGMAISRR